MNLEMLDNFKTEILSDLSEQVEMLRIKNEKKEDADIFVIHAESYATKCCSSFPRFKEVYKEDNGERKSTKKLCYVAPWIPWKPSELDMVQGSTSQLQAYSHPSQTDWDTFPP